MPSPAARQPVQGELITIDDQVVEIRRSARRRRTVSGHQADGRLIVLIPAGMSRRDEERNVRHMVQRLREPGPRHRSDESLVVRAEQLATKYLGGAAQPASVRWVTNQNKRWGSCTPATREIRLSDRLRGMPGYVVDAVLLHELAHLIEAGHGRAFWALLSGYPDLLRAQAYLDGVSFGSGLTVDGPDVDQPELIDERRDVG